MKIKTSEMKNRVVKLMAYLIAGGKDQENLEDIAIENIQNQIQNKNDFKIK